MLKLYDTASKDYLDWSPGNKVRMYVCGITPYDSAHLGHVFTFMTYDLIQRRLEASGREVVMVRNVTDVDEPIYKRAAQLGVDYRDLALKETESFRSVMTQLHFRPPEAEPLASDFIHEMAEAVSKLLASGHAYYVDQDVYFDTARDPSFGKFAGFHDGLLHGLMRKRGGDTTRPGKRHPLDFLLWKAVPDSEDPAAWDSPVGRGRPGWHIECSVMSCSLLGVPFDLHGGGNDLIFPHHECELAQNRALGSPKTADVWMHVAPIHYGGEKMSKSLGNLVFAADLLQQYDPSAIRLALMHYHYREGGEWIPELLDDATELLERLYRAEPHVGADACRKLYSEVCEALADDLDTHRIVHSLEDFVSAARDADQSVPDGPGGTLGDTLRLLGLAT